MRDAGVSVSFWISEKDDGVIPQIKLTQIVENVLTEEEKIFQSRVFDALVINHEKANDCLKIVLTRPNESPDEGTNDGKASQGVYTVTLNQALNNGKDWHHIVVLWNGEVNGSNQGEIIDLVVIIDGLSSFVNVELENSSEVVGVPLTTDDYYDENIIASRFILSADDNARAIDEVRLIKGIASPSLIKAFGASRQTSGDPLIVWNADQTITNLKAVTEVSNSSPIPGLEDNYKGIPSGTITLDNNSFTLDGSSYLTTNSNPLYVNQALAIESWFKANNPNSKLPLFDVDLSYGSDVEGIQFNTKQGLNVIYDYDNLEFQVNIIAEDIARHEISRESDLRNALQAVLTNPIPNQKFKIVITQNIDLLNPLPPLVGSQFEGEQQKKLAPGTVLTIESKDPSAPNHISGQNNIQIFVIDADDCTINFKNLILCDGKAKGGDGNSNSGGGLGAGGALFIAGGAVNIENVQFINNQAMGGKGGTSNENGLGGGGDAKNGERVDPNKTPDDPTKVDKNDGYTGGQGGLLNGDFRQTAYYQVVSPGGDGGDGGAFGYNSSHSGTAGGAGVNGGFGTGGGGGGGGGGGFYANTGGWKWDGNTGSGKGGNGGDGGWGAGSGGGGGSGAWCRNKTNPSPATGGSPGNAGKFGTSGGAGEKSEYREVEGNESGNGGHGAGLGGAIFVADFTNLSGLPRRPRLTVDQNCSFEGNSVTAGGEGAQAQGEAIFFESESFVCNNSDFPPGGITPEIGDYRVSTLEDLVKAIYEANQSEVDNQIILENDITLADEPFEMPDGKSVNGKNLLIQKTSNGTSSGSLVIRSQEGYKHFISGGNKFQIISMDNLGGYLELYNLELKEGLAQGGDSINGGGGGLGAGGALFVNSGQVVVDSVTFSNNKAIGGKGGSQGSATGDNDNDCSPAGDGGRVNANSTLILGETGEGGLLPTEIMKPGYDGTVGEWGNGGGAGSAPRYHLYRGDGGEGRLRDAGNGGKGGFGAGGGAGAANATISEIFYGGASVIAKEEYHQGIPGSGGATGTYGTPGTGGTTGPDNQAVGGTAGSGGAGAGLGGAIFVRNASGPGQNDTFVSVKNSTFIGNDVPDNNGKAIFTESLPDPTINDPGNLPIDYRSDEGLITQGSAKQALAASSSAIDTRVESVTYTYASNDITSDWHHIATSFTNGGVPQVFLDGIPLPRTDENPAIEINQDQGFYSTETGVVRWGYVSGVETGFSGKVNGLQFFDRSLSSNEICDSASENIQRLIIQLDDTPDAEDSALCLYQFPSSAAFNTTWIKRFQGSPGPSEVNNPTTNDWNTIKASLGDGLVIELVGTGNGNDFGYTNGTTLSNYNPDELVTVLKELLPGGLSAAELFISATYFVDPDGYDRDDITDEKELTPETEPATLRFSAALLEAGLTESVNYGPLKRFTADNNLEFKQTQDIWVSYEQVNEENPVIVDYTHKSFGVGSIISIGKKIYTLVDKGYRIYKWKKSINQAIDQDLTPSISVFRQYEFDPSPEPINLKRNKPDSLEPLKSRRKTAQFYDIFRIGKAKTMKILVKNSEFVCTGMKLLGKTLQLATISLSGAVLGSGTSVADALNKRSSQGSQLFKNNKNKILKKRLGKATKYIFKNGALTIVCGPLTVYGSVQLFKTGNTYDIVKGSLQIMSGFTFPLVEVGIEALIATEFTTAAAAGPIGLGIAIASLVIDVVIIIGDLIRKAIQRQKLAKKATKFASEGYINLINDIKGSLDNIDDLYISGRFSDAAAEISQLTDTDVLTGVTSWLYQALRSSSDQVTMDNILNVLTEEQKELPVTEFISQLLDGTIQINGVNISNFTGIYERWTQGEEIGDDEVIKIVDIDLISDSSIIFKDNNLRECFQQFLGERLDDGGTQSSEPDNEFSAGEALALNGDMTEYRRNIAVYGADAEGLREEVKTGKGNDTIILGIGHFHIETQQGNNTIFLTKDFKDIENTHLQEQYYLDAGDIDGASILTQRQKDSDTLIINGSVHVNLTRMKSSNQTQDGTPKQAVFFQYGSLNGQTPLLVSGLENVYGSHEDDTLVSNAEKCSTLTANQGNNILVTGYGVATDEGTLNIINTFKGGTGNDTLYGSHAGGEGYNSLSGGPGGNNLIIADEGVNILHGGPGNDTLVATIHPGKKTDNIFIFGFGDGNDCIEKGLKHLDIGLNYNDMGDFSQGINFVYGLNNDEYNYTEEDPIINDPNQVRDILQFGEGVTATNVRVSVGGDSTHTEPVTGTAISSQVTFSLIVDDTRVFDALTNDDLTKPNLYTGDSITIKGNWNSDKNWSHRIKTLRFGDGSSLEIAHINTWDTTGTVKNDNVTLQGATFFQGFSGNDTITAEGGNNVILPGSGDNLVTINGNNDQVLINRNPLNQDTINITGSDRNLTLVLDGSIRLRDIGFALEGNNLTLTIGNGGNLIGATQTLVITNAIGNLLLKLGNGLTLNLTPFTALEVYQGDNNDNTLTANGPALFSGGFGKDTLNGGAIGPSIFICGAGNDIITGSQDNSGDIYILEDRGGMKTITGLNNSNPVSNKTILMVNTNAEFMGSAVLKRDEIWFATTQTLITLDQSLDLSYRDKLPDELNKLSDGQLLIWIRTQNAGAIITDWEKWDNTNRLVVTNQYEGAFEITKDGINRLLKRMNQYIDKENQIYSPWYPDLGDEDTTLALNEELSNAILKNWISTSSIIPEPQTSRKQQPTEVPQITESRATVMKSNLFNALTWLFVLMIWLFLILYIFHL